MTAGAVSTLMRPSTGRQRRSPLPAVAAVVGVLLAVAWALVALQVLGAQRDAADTRARQSARALVDLLRATVRARAAADVQMLAQDPRLQATLSVPNIDDETIRDILQDLRRLNEAAIFAVLTPGGRVRVALGAPHLEGVDLSTSAVVQTALEKDSAALGTWMVEDRVAEVALSSVRAGDRVVALLAIGNRLDDAALATVARSAQVHLALVVDGQPAWSDTTQPASTWLTTGAERIEVQEAVPPARFVAVPARAEAPPASLVWAVPVFALGFALLAFWRGGVR